MQDVKSVLYLHRHAISAGSIASAVGARSRLPHPIIVEDFGQAVSFELTMNCQLHWIKAHQQLRVVPVCLGAK